MRHRENLVRQGAISERGYDEGSEFAVMELVIASLGCGFKLVQLEGHKYLLEQAESSQG